MNDVLEFLIDGTSGLAPGGVEGAAIVAGVCSLGAVGQGYLLGKSSDLEGLLGVGPLTDRLRDLFAAGGQNPIVIAVPVSGSPAKYYSPIAHVGTGPEAAVSGSPVENADAIIKISTGGVLGVAEYQLSEDGGANWGIATATPADGIIAVGTTGVNITLAAGDHVVDDTYSSTIRISIGPVARVGSGPDITAAGIVKAAAEVVLTVVTGGGRNVGIYSLSEDGGDSDGPEKTIPADGLIVIGSTGVTITVPDNPDMVAGDTYSFDLLAPVPSISSVMTALETPLETYDVEFVYIVGPSDSTDWAVMGAKADELWNAHRPTFFLGEARLPYDGESIDIWTAALIADKAGYSHRFVSVCAAYGEVADSTGKRVVRNWAGLLAGRILSIPVVRHIGRVRDNGISQGTIPNGYTESHQSQLETTGYITAKNYAGLNSAYWGDDKTLADITSDYQFLTVLRTVFKAVRKARIAALKSMFAEAGDALLGAEASGLSYLRASIEGALDTLRKAIPKELAAYEVSIPDGQDIVNNGVAVEMTLIGIPIIKVIKLYTKYVYAGGTFDPRIES